MRSGPTALQGSIRLGQSPTAPSHGSFHPHFASHGLATQALIRAGKTSHTAGTLCEIGRKKLFTSFKNKIFVV
jgi:hypothetical protein